MQTFAAPKPSLSKAGDALENEADRIARQAVRHGLSAASDPYRTMTAARAEHAETRALHEGGRPLSPPQRAFFEPRFGHDFSSVRIHADERAAASAQRLHARAYTTSESIVFGSGAFEPATVEGRHLLAHELAHVVQQRTSRAPQALVQRQEFGPEATGAPATWQADVRAATTSAARANCLQVALGLTVADKTADSAGDASPSAAHLVAYTSAAPAVNYDDALASKTSPVDHHPLASDAGYTVRWGNRVYIVLGPKAIKETDFFASRTTLNHELEHVRQWQSGSRLAGNESELDAWTSTFVRDFHRSYILKQKPPSTVRVQYAPAWAPLLFYYSKSDVSAAQKDACAARITAYYNATIQPHAGNAAVFRFWVHRSLRSETPDLAQRLNADLHLGIDPTADSATTRQFPLGSLPTLTYASAPVVDQPSGVGAPAPPARKP